MVKPMKIITPENIAGATKEELVEALMNVKHIISDMIAHQVVLREKMFDGLEGDGEVISNHNVSKAKKTTYLITLDEARELGAIKDAIDKAKLKVLEVKGVKIEKKVTEYLLIKEIVVPEKVIKTEK